MYRKANICSSRQIVGDGKSMGRYPSPEYDRTTI